MPARKPAGLNVGAATKAAKAARIAGEQSVTPTTDLPLDAPSFFVGMPTAAKIYRRIMRYYSEVDAVIVTRLDQDLLVNYCVLLEEQAQLQDLRLGIYKRLKRTETSDDPMAAQANLDNLIKLDGRIDRKKALIHQYAQSLYLTPRARAGAAPEKKQPEEAPDPLELLLNNVNDFVNGAGDAK